MVGPLSSSFLRVFFFKAQLACVHATKLSVATIVEEFNKFVKTNQSLRDANKTDAKGKSLKDVGALIRAAPQYTEQLSKVCLRFASTCRAHYN